MTVRNNCDMLARNIAVEITKDNIDDISYDNIAVITIATGPAQGEPNGLMIATKDLKVFHTNKCIYYDPEMARQWDINPDKIVPIEEFLKKVPLKISTNGLQIFNNDQEWEMVYMNYGNYLFIRKEFAKKFLKLIDDHEGKSRIWWIYDYWYDLLCECLGKKIKHEAPLMDEIGIISWMRFKKMDDGVVLGKNFNLIDGDKKRDIYEFAKEKDKPIFVIYDKEKDTIMYIDSIKKLKPFL